MLAPIGLAEPSQSKVRQTTALPEPLHEHSWEHLPMRAKVAPSLDVQLSASELKRHSLHLAPLRSLLQVEPPPAA